MGKRGRENGEGGVKREGGRKEGWGREGERGKRGVKKGEGERESKGHWKDRRKEGVRKEMRRQGRGGRSKQVTNQLIMSLLQLILTSMGEIARPLN